MKLRENFRTQLFEEISRGGGEACGVGWGLLSTGMRHFYCGCGTHTHTQTHSPAGALLAP